ncbi:uncharacterized protein LOC119593494 [Penaeus monodon]|uniref:uncharacterized protein LOC119593494 n=1 Tax=Penaeus monodon TaxID=6687 RepID=UPI0018A7929E|nr:uncharacterized protein LOC119593494 [Penaeus monodon]
MKVLALLALCVGAALGKATRGNAAYTYAYNEPGMNGFYQLFTDYVPNLLTSNFDNAISSVYQTGMWLYYENVEYNQASGRVYWVHGIEISVDFPQEYSNMCSSLKFVGSPDYMNVDTWTVFEGPIFTGSEYYGEADAANLGSLTDQGSSIILTGTSPWTFYDGNSWTGSSLCLYPNTDQDTGSQGQVLNYGIYPDVKDLGITDNTIGSVRKGCWSKNVVKVEPLKAEYRGRNGAWGILEP